MDMYFYTNLFCLVSGSVVSWYLIIRFFDIVSATGQLLAGLIIGIFSGLSFLAFLMVNKKDSWRVRFFYKMSFCWLGCLLDFVLMAAVLGIVFWLLCLAGINYPSWILKTLIIGSTIAVAAWSFWNAYDIKVKEAIVSIKNLPETWNNCRVAHISDIHLGPILRAKFFRRLVTKIEQVAPEALFITGDFFDGSESDFSWIVEPLKELKAPRGVYYSFGNHDFILGADRVNALLDNGQITILANKMVERDGLQIVGLNFTPDKDFDLKRAVLSATGYDGARPSILLYHEPKDTVKSQGVGIDLQLSGHTHGGQMFPFNLLAKLYYHNHSWGLFRRGDYTLSVTSGVGTWGPPMRLGTKAEIVVLTLRAK
jgi:predicted MPP superfamily phosphohydrolase